MLSDVEKVNYLKAWNENSLEFTLNDYPTKPNKLYMN